MSQRSRTILRNILLLITGIVAVLVIIVIAELSVLSKRDSTKDPKRNANGQPVYPPPALARTNQNINQQGSYPPPSLAPLSPTKKIAASPTLVDGTLSLDNVQRTAVQDAKIALDSNKAIFLDVRSKESFDHAHIPGAKSIPEAQIAARVKELDPDQWIITYCS